MKDGMKWFNVTGLQQTTLFSMTYLYEKKEYVAIVGMHATSSVICDDDGDGDGVDC